MNVPAVENVRLNVPPGTIDPEFHAPLSDVDVCVVLSLLVHVTVPPTARLTGFGANAVDVIVDPPNTIETGVPGPEGVGEGEVSGAELLESPQPAAMQSSRRALSAVRNLMFARTHKIRTTDADRHRHAARASCCRPALSIAQDRHRWRRLVRQSCHDLPQRRPF